MHTFSKVLALREIQTASSKIWTQVVVSIFYDHSHYNSNSYNLVFWPFLFHLKNI